MFGVLAAGTAVLAQNEFLGSVGFVSLGDIVEVPAFRAL